MKIQALTAVALLLSTPLYANEPMAPAGDDATAASSPATQPDGSVARATLTSEIMDREPADNLATLSNDQNHIYYFTEIRNMPGGSVTHRWEYNGEVMAEVPFNIGGSRWRIYSSKNLDPQWLGEWKVSTVDANGSIMSVNTFTYTEMASAATEQPAAIDDAATAASAQ